MASNSSRIKGITIEIDGNTTGLTKAISSVNSTIYKMNTALRDVDRLLKFDPTNTELLKQKQRQLATEIDATKQKLTTLKEASRQAEQELANGKMSQERFDALQREIIETEQKLKMLENQSRQSASVVGMQFQAWGEKIEETGKKISEFGDKLAGVGKGLTMKVTMPIVAGFAAATKASVDWETAFTGVRKTVDASESEYEELADGIKKMSTEMASSKEEIAGVMEIAGQLGVSGTNDLLKFTKTMVELGDTTNLSADEAATSLARFLNITEGGYDNVDKIGSAVVDLGNNFATSESEIVAMSTRLAAAGKIAGLSSTDILALSAAMSSVGIEAEAGGTAMTQTMKSITEAVEKAGDATADADGKFTDKLNHIAKIAGMTSEDFAKAWREKPAKALTNFIKGLGNLESEGENATLVLDDLGMSGIRQSNMLQSLALASDQLSSALEVSAKAYKQNIALTDEASKRYETMQAKLTQTKEKIKNLGIDIGDRLLPYVDKLLDKVGEWIKKWDELDDAHKDQILKIAAVAAAVGPLLVVMGTVISTIGKIVTGVGSVVKAIGKAISAISGLAMANPIFLAIAASVAAVAAALVICNQRTKEAHDKAAELSDAERELSDRVKGACDAFDQQKDAYRGVIEQIDLEYREEQKLIDELDGIVDANGRVKKGYEERAQVIVNQLAEAFDIEIEYQDGVIQKYGEVMQTIDQLIAKKKAEALINAGQQDYIDALQDQQKALEDITNAEKNLKDAKSDLNAAQREYNKSVEAYYKKVNDPLAFLPGNMAHHAAEVLIYKQRMDEAAATLEGAQEKVTGLETDLENANKAFVYGQTTITNYENLLDAAAGGASDLDFAIRAMSNNLITAANGTEDVLQEQSDKAWQTFHEMQKRQQEGTIQMSKSQLDQLEQFAIDAENELNKYYGETDRIHSTAAEKELKRESAEYKKRYDQAENAYSKQTRLETESEKNISNALNKERQKRNQNDINNRTDHYKKIENLQKTSEATQTNQAVTAQNDRKRDLEIYNRSVETATQNSYNALQTKQRAHNTVTQSAQSTHNATIERMNSAHRSSEQTAFANWWSVRQNTNNSNMTHMRASISSHNTAVQQINAAHHSQLQSSFSATWAGIQNTNNANLAQLQGSTSAGVNAVWSAVHASNNANSAYMQASCRAGAHAAVAAVQTELSQLSGIMATSGHDAVNQLASALHSGVGRVSAGASAIANAISSRLHFSVPDIGPLSDADTYMPDFIDLLVKGIDEGIPKVAEANDELANALVPALGTDAAVGQMNDSLTARMDLLTSVVVRYLPMAAEEKKVVLFPDKLVGELAPDINRALGAMG